MDKRNLSIHERKVFAKLREDYPTVKTRLNTECLPIEWSNGKAALFTESFELLKDYPTKLLYNPVNKLEELGFNKFNTPLDRLNVYAVQGYLRYEILKKLVRLSPSQLSGIGFMKHWFDVQCIKEYMYNPAFTAIEISNFVANQARYTEIEESSVLAQQARFILEHIRDCGICRFTPDSYELWLSKEFDILELELRMSLEYLWVRNSNNDKLKQRAAGFADSCQYRFLGEITPF